MCKRQDRVTQQNEKTEGASDANHLDERFTPLWRPSLHIRRFCHETVKVDAYQIAETIRRYSETGFAIVHRYAPMPAWSQTN